MKAILNQALQAIALGFLIQIFSGWMQTSFLETFFKANLITILVALLAINATTLSIVLTKMRELIDLHGGDFTSTKNSMLLSIKEQISLIALAVLFLSAQDSKITSSIEHAPLLLDVLIISIFIYALMTLYDTAKSVFIIIDYK